MTDLLKSAQQKLSLRTVLLRDSKISFSHEYETDFRDTVPQKIQTFSGVKSCNEIEFSSKEFEAQVYFEYKYLHASGVRIVPANSKEDQEEDDIDEDAVSVIFEIKAIFEVSYLSEEKVSPEELNEFGKQNVPFNTWPFWREYVQSTCLRMNIRPVSLPFKWVSES